MARRAGGRCRVSAHEAKGTGVAKRASMGTMARRRVMAQRAVDNGGAAVRVRKRSTAYQGWNAGVGRFNMGKENGSGPALVEEGEHRQRFSVTGKGRSGPHALDRILKSTALSKFTLHTMMIYIG